MTIDVLLAAYNGERWLGEQLRSLQRQAFADFRVLMQDDGSTDGTADILWQTARDDARFEMAAACGKHLGAAGNFLSLMQQSDAPYAALCDQDDIWAPDRLSRCLDAMRDAEDRYGAGTPLLVHSDSCLVDESGRVTHTSFFRHQGWAMDALTLPRLLVQNNVTGCTVLMNAALRDLVAGHATGENIGLHDWTIALTAAAFGHIVLLDLPLVHYRQHGGNAIGASTDSGLKRVLRAAAEPDAIRRRLDLTYANAARFAAMYEGILPEKAERCISAYLALQKRAKPARIAGLLRGGYTMQSPMTRLAQMLFG